MCHDASAPFAGKLGYMVFEDGMIAVCIFPEERVFRFALTVYFKDGTVIVQHPIRAFYGRSISHSEAHGRVQVTVRVMSPLEYHHHRTVFLNDRRGI